MINSLEEPITPIFNTVNSIKEPILSVINSLEEPITPIFSTVNSLKEPIFSLVFEEPITPILIRHFNL